MFERSVGRVRSGDRSLSARDLNRAFGILDSLANLTGSGIDVDDTVGGVSLNVRTPTRIHIRILSGSNPYAWEQVAPLEDGTWVESGTYSGEGEAYGAYERNGAESVPAGYVAEAKLEPATVDGGVPRWLFDGPTTTDGFWARLDCRVPFGDDWEYGWTEMEFAGKGDAATEVDEGRKGYVTPTLIVTTTTEGDGSTQEVQTARVYGPPFTSGAWTLGGAALAYDVDAASLETALESSLGVGVSVSGSMASGFTITWDSNGDQTLLTGSVAGLLPAESDQPAYEANGWKARVGAIVRMYGGFPGDDDAGPDFRFGLTLDSCSWDGITGFDPAAAMNVLTIDADGCLAAVQPEACS